MAYSKSRRLANVVTSTGEITAADANITNVADIALDTISADASSISIASPVVINGTTPSLTIGDAGEEDTKIVFDGAAQDFYMGLDDTADDLILGLGSAVGTTPAIHIDENQVVTFDAGVSDEYTEVDGVGSPPTVTLNCREGNTFMHELATGTTTFVFSNPADSGKSTIFLLKLIQDSTARDVTWPGSVDWAAGTAPTITTTNDGVDIFVFMTHDGGTNWYGFTAGQAMATPA